MKYIFEVTMHPGHHIKEYADLWVAESIIIQKEPGALGTRLHRVIGHEDKLLAIASWESKAARDAAMSRLETHVELNAMRDQHNKIVTFKLLGEVEEPDWVVLPDES